MLLKPEIQKRKIVAKQYNVKDEKDVFIGLGVLGVILVFLLIGIPADYTPLYPGQHQELVLEFVASYLSFGLFSIFLARYFLLYNQALLFLGTAFFSAFVASIVRRYGLPTIGLESSNLYFAQAILSGATKAIMIGLLMLSAFNFERISRREDIKNEALKYTGITLVLTLLVSFLVIFFIPRLLVTSTTQTVWNTIMLIIRIALITGSFIVAIKFYYGYLQKREKLLLWFTVAMLLSMANDVYYITIGKSLGVSHAMAVIIKILSYTTFAIGMIDDYIWYLLKEKEVSTNLEKIIIKRTEELQIKNRELEEKTKESLEASRLKSELLANMSHELRTPMNAIIGFTHRVIKKCTDILPDRQLRNLKTVERNAHHLLGLINSILDVSKVEAGRMEVLIEPFHLYELIEEVIEMSAPLVGDKTIKLLYECPDDIYVNSDRTKVKQMLINLIGNSIKFTEEGGVKITVRRASNIVLEHDMHQQGPKLDDNVFGKQTAACLKRKNEFVQILVSDTGIGIKEESMPYIFDEFRQVDGSLTRKTGGTGLGLAIVKKFSVLLGGDVQVESSYKRGTCFTIILPVDSRFAARTKTDIDLEKKGEEIKQCILCISNDQTVAMKTRECVESAGFAFDIARNTEEVMEKAKEKRPYAIALDLLMDTNILFSTIHEIKGDPVTATCPIVALSILDNGARAYDIATADYVPKPIGQRTILDGIFRAAVHQRIEKILVVDDNEDVHDLFRQMLAEAKRYQLLFARNGSEAIQIVKQEKPDLVFLDLVMPGVDGFLFLEKMSSEIAINQIALIIMTPKDLDPREVEQFQKRVREVVEKSKRRTEEMLMDVLSVARAV